MQDERESGYLLLDLLQDVEAQLRLLTGFELVCAVSCAYCYRQTVYAGAGDELHHVVRVGERAVFVVHVNVVLYARYGAKFALHHDAALVRVGHHFLSDLYVLFELVGGCVYHYGGEAVVHAGLADLRGLAVVQMQGDGDVRGLCRGSERADRVFRSDELERAFGKGEYQRSLYAVRACHYSLDYVHAVGVESAYGVTAVVRFFEHFFSRYQSHC